MNKRSLKPDTFDSFGNQQLDVYDQCCGNCHNTQCPMMLQLEEKELEQFTKKEREALNRTRRQDATRENGKIQWCIFWEGKTQNTTSRNEDTDYIIRDFGDGDCDDEFEEEDEDEPSYCEYFDE